MGVKLQNIIVRKQIDYKALVGKIIAIDAPNIIMGLFNFARKNPDGICAGLILDRTQSSNYKKKKTIKNVLYI